MSQYKDSITGQVRINLRVIDGKLYNLIKGNKYIIYTLENAGPNFSNKTIAEVKQTYIDTSQHPSFSEGSLVSNLSYIHIYENINVSTDWTISHWERFSTNLINYNVQYSSYVCIYYSGSNTWYALSLPFYNLKNSNFYNYMDCYTNNTYDKGTNNSTLPSLNTWFHVAIVKSGSTISEYINGVKSLTLVPSNTTLNNMNNKTCQRLSFGSIHHSSSDAYYSCPVWYDDFVFINGQALWTSNFTVPNDYLTGSYDGKLRKRMRCPTKRNCDSSIFIFN